jgi:hypothetical protein
LIQPLSRPVNWPTWPAYQGYQLAISPDDLAVLYGDRPLNQAVAEQDTTLIADVASDYGAKFSDRLV